MERFVQIVDSLANFIWGFPMIILVLCGGGYLIYMTQGWVFRNFAYILKNTFGKFFAKGEKSGASISPVQAMATALAGTIGAGNIVGVATAIKFGGPGAIFWIWVAAIFSMTTKFAEVVLAVATRDRNEDGEFSGGPMYYLSNGLGQRGLAMIFAGLGAVAILGTGALVQSNAMANATFNMTGIDLRIIGFVIMLVLVLIIIGGIKRIGAFAERIVPIMTVLYLGGAIIVLIINRKAIPGAFGLIFAEAFNPSAVAGGSLLLTIRHGFARGIFSNEAGLGTAPMAHAAADTDHPVRQGLWGAVEVFISSIIICTTTALVILTSGYWNDAAVDANSLPAMAFGSAIPSLGNIIVSLAIMLFAFTTLVSWYYYGDKCISYITKSKGIRNIYKLIYIIFSLVGSLGGLRFVWVVSDLANALMAIPNFIGLILLAPVVVRITCDFNDSYKDTGKKGDYSWSFDNHWSEAFKN